MAHETDLDIAIHDPKGITAFFKFLMKELKLQKDSSFVLKARVCCVVQFAFPPPPFLVAWCTCSGCLSSRTAHPLAAALSFGR